MMRTLLAAAVAMLLACAPAPKKPAGAPLAPGTRINVNTADVVTLKRLPGIGSKEARRIIEHRQAHGPFTTVDDLLAVKKVGKKDLEKIRPYVVVR